MMPPEGLAGCDQDHDENNGDHVKHEAYSKMIRALEDELAQSGTLFMDRAGLTKALGIVQRMRRRECGS